MKISAHIYALCYRAVQGAQIPRYKINAVCIVHFAVYAHAIVAAHAVFGNIEGLLIARGNELCAPLHHLWGHRPAEGSNRISLRFFCINGRTLRACIHRIAVVDIQPDEINRGRDDGQILCWHLR